MEEKLLMLNIQSPISYLVFLGCFWEKMEHFQHPYVLLTKVLNKKKSYSEENKPSGLPFQCIK